MFINWYGQAFFKITTKNQQETTIAIDPFDPATTGLKAPKTQADILLISHNHKDHSYQEAITGSPFIIDSAGEYEIREIIIKGIPAFHDNNNGKERGEVVLYTILAEEIKIAFLSDLGQKELTDEQLEALGRVDILLIPVGGVYTINAREAADIVNQIEPLIVIPMHYKIPNLKFELDDVDKFLKEMGEEQIESVTKLKITPKDLPSPDDETKIIVLTPS